MTKFNREAPKPAIWGFHSVIACLESYPHLIQEIFVDKSELDKPRPRAEVAAVKRYADGNGISMQAFAREPEFLKERRHQGIYARLLEFPSQSFSEFKDEFIAKVREPGRLSQWVYLDGIQDPRNFGAILRSAAAFGLSGVFVGSRSQAPLNGVVAQTSAGNAFRVPVVHCSNAQQVLSVAEDEAMVFLGLDMAGQDLHSYFSGPNWAEKASPILWILGGEGEGVKNSLLERCHATLKLPMAPGVESLNASVAASLAFYQAYVASRKS